MWVFFYIALTLFNVSVENIDNNYWEDGNGDAELSTNLNSNSVPFNKVDIFEPVVVNAAKNDLPDVVCSGFSAIVEGGSSQRQMSISSDSCILLSLTADSYIQAGQYQKAHDMYTDFVETCTGTVKTYGAFSSMGITNQMRNTDLNRYVTHREWLKKVLYYDLDTLYYCEDVASMLGTFRYFDSSHSPYPEAGLAISKYLVDSAKCGYLRETLSEGIDNGIQELYEDWKDTVTDSLQTPFHLHIPSLEELDLTILRGPQNSITPTTRELHIGELIATRNPFTDILELKYRLSKSAMARIDVYDLLGKAVYSEGQGYKPEGEYILSLQTKGWSSGSYYVRLSSPSGEVKTVKVVKE